MSEAFIVDAHVHLGQPGAFFAPETGAAKLLAMMDRLGIQSAIGTDHLSIHEGCGTTLPGLRELFERSQGRLHYLGVFDPRRSEECLRALEAARDWPGLAGLKIHPSFHRTPAEHPSYGPAWRFAAEQELPILTHSWSVSDYNPVQALSTPDRFEGWVRQFPEVRLVLGHAGGRGLQQEDALRMANEYPQVYLDIAGDVFCFRLIEKLVERVPVSKVLFGSDFPWLDPRANLSRVLLADVPLAAKARILVENAHRVYRLGGTPC
jgi:predicted TIM-barrel fold metal-dependent hydrolase